MRKQPNLFIFTLLVAVLGTGCGEGENHPTTPETREDRMYSTLREDPDAKKIHQELVSNVKQQCCLRHENLKETEAQKLAEKQIDQFEKLLIQRFAEQNGQVWLEPSDIDAQLEAISSKLARLKSSQLSQEEKNRQTAMLCLEEKNLYLIEKLFMILIAANNRE